VTDSQSFAQLDFQREQRCGFPEVVFAQGKTASQITLLLKALADEHGVALATRVNTRQARRICAELPEAAYLASCKLLFIDRREPDLRVSGEDVQAALSDDAQALIGDVVVCCAGTSDLPVAEEAAVTARLMGSRVTLLADVGIAGVHRLLAREQELRAARCVVAVAGMEGALPSLVAGLVEVPVIAVPTSVGYGASFGGLAALLAMLNSCACGVSVVNINNGFGAGAIAHRINAGPRRSEAGACRDGAK
jgi:NCAIR mutase (PurE)-related protein